MKVPFSEGEEKSIFWLMEEKVGQRVSEGNEVEQISLQQLNRKEKRNANSTKTAYHNPQPHSDYIFTRYDLLMPVKNRKKNKEVAPAEAVASSNAETSEANVEPTARRVRQQRRRPTRGTRGRDTPDPYSLDLGPTVRRSIIRMVIIVCIFFFSPSSGSICFVFHFLPTHIFFLTPSSSVPSSVPHFCGACLLGTDPKKNPT